MSDALAKQIMEKLIDPLNQKNKAKTAENKRKESLERVVTILKKLVSEKRRLRSEQQSRALDYKPVASNVGLEVESGNLQDESLKEINGEQGNLRPVVASADELASRSARDGKRKQAFKDLVSILSSFLEKKEKTKALALAEEEARALEEEARALEEEAKALALALAAEQERVQAQADADALIRTQQEEAVKTRAREVARAAAEKANMLAEKAQAATALVEAKKQRQQRIHEMVIKTLERVTNQRKQQEYKNLVSTLSSFVRQKAQALVAAKTEALAAAKAEEEAAAMAKEEAQSKADAEAERLRQANAAAQIALEAEAKAQAENEAQERAAAQELAQAEVEKAAREEAEAKLRAEAAAQALAQAQAALEAERLRQQEQAQIALEAERLRQQEQAQIALEAERLRQQEQDKKQQTFKNLVSILSTFVKRRNKITEYDCEDKIKKREAELQVIIDDLLRRQQDCEDNIKIKEAEHIETINEYTRRLRECDENIVKLNDDHERDLRHNVDMLNANIRATKTDLDTLRERYTEINNRYKEELQGHRLSDQQLEAMRKQTDEFRVQLDKKDTDYRELNEQLVTALGDAEAATKAKDEAVRSAKEATEESMRESASEVDRKRDSYYKVVSVLSKFINIKKEEAAAEEREREIAEINNAFERERQDLEAGRKLMEAELKEQHEADKIEAINQARLEEVANAEVVAKAAAEEKEKELDGIKQRLLTVRNKAKKYGVILTSMKGELQKKQEDLEALNISKVEAAEKAEAIIRERQEELDAAAGGLRASEEAHKRIREEQEPNQAGICVADRDIQLIWPEDIW